MSDATAIENVLETICRLPRRGRLVAKTPAVLMQAVQGRWYRCNPYSRNGRFPVHTWPKYARGMTLGNDVFHLLELTADGRFIRATAQDMDDVVDGTFGVSTFGAFYEATKRRLGPLPMPVPPGHRPHEMANVVVLTLPQPRFGVVFPVEPIVSISPRTMVIGDERFLALGELIPGSGVASRPHITSRPRNPHECWPLPSGGPPNVPLCDPRSAPVSEWQAKVEALCRQPRKGRIEPKTPAQLMRLVEGRWYYCGDDSARVHFPISPREHLDGIELRRGHWYVLQITKDGRLARAKPHRESGPVQGRYAATTHGAFRAQLKRRPASSVPVPMANPKFPSYNDDQPVLTVPQPRNGVIFPVEPALSTKPRTLAIDGEHFVAVD